MRLDGLPRALDSMASGLPQAVRDTWQAKRPAILRGLASVLSDRIQAEVFGAAASPTGESWAKLAPLTVALYGALGRPASKPGGAGKLRESWKLGGADNIYREHAGGFEFGSGLTRNGVSVTDGFEATFRVPASDDPEKRARVRAFMARMVGIPAPGKGRHLAHPGRRIAGLKAEWLRAMTASGEAALLGAIEEAIAGAFKQADLEVEMVRARTPGAAGGFQLF